MPKSRNEEPTWDTLVDGSIPAASSDEDGASANEGRKAENIVALAPGKYEAVLIKGKKIEGIPKDAIVHIDLGSQGEVHPSKRQETKSFSLYKHPDTGTYVISTEIDDTAEQETYWKEHPMLTRIISNGYHQIEMKEGEEVILGRECNEETLPISDKHSLVSRRHLSVSLKNGLYTLEDLNSSNGSYVEFTVEAPPLRDFKI
jgi:hypothetical protein